MRRYANEGESSTCGVRRNFAASSAGCCCDRIAVDVSQSLQQLQERGCGAAAAAAVLQRLYIYEINPVASSSSLCLFIYIFNEKDPNCQIWNPNLLTLLMESSCQRPTFNAGSLLFIFFQFRKESSSCKFAKWLVLTDRRTICLESKDKVNRPLWLYVWLERIEAVQKLESPTRPERPLIAISRKTSYSILLEDRKEVSMILCLHRKSWSNSLTRRGMQCRLKYPIRSWGEFNSLHSFLIWTHSFSTHQLTARVLIVC